MLGTATALTLVTLTGLAAGFAREWLLVAGWGAGGRTDAFLVALFLPEAIRTVLGGGLLSSAGLALWSDLPEQRRSAWLSSTSASLALLSIALALVLSVGAPIWVSMVGPGLSVAQHASGIEALRLLAYAIPGIVLQAWWTVPMQSAGYFLRAGFGSLLFNLPAIAYMFSMKSRADEVGLASSFVVGSMLMLIPLTAPTLRAGLQLGLMRPDLQPLRALGRLLLPLTASAGVGQLLLLLERVVASFLGEGSLTVINLARKLVNVPLVALSSLNQVLLGLMSRQAGNARLALLGRGLTTVTVLSLPTAVAMILASDAITRLLFGGIPGNGRIQPLLAWYAATVTFAGWNAMIARFSYADADTRTPLLCELSGNALQAVMLPLLAWWFGTLGMAISILMGTLLTGQMLMHKFNLWGRFRIVAQCAMSAMALAGAGFAAALLLHQGTGLQLSVAVAAGVTSLLLLGAWLRPWQRPEPVATSMNTGDRS